MFTVRTARLVLLLIGSAWLVAQSAAVPDRPAPGQPADTRVVVVVPAKVETFGYVQLEVTLYEYDPRAKGKETQIDKHVKKAFGHNLGVESSLPITLGGNARLKPEMLYYVKVEAFDRAGKRTHLAEQDGKRGACHVLTAGKPSQVTMIVRQATSKDVVLDIVEEIKKGNNPKVEAMAKARAKDFEELLDIEDFYRRRNKGGLGWGATPGNNAVQDGLETRMLALTRAVPVNFAQDAKNNEEAAAWIAAIAELTAAKPEFRPMGRKTLEDWRKKAGQLRADTEEFAKAIAANNPVAIRKSAQAVVNACNSCHEIYRD
jgi:hypothetical protein